MPIIPRQFRLGDETLEALDRIAAMLSKEFGQAATRSAAIRYAANYCDPMIGNLKRRPSSVDDVATDATMKGKPRPPAPGKRKNLGRHR